MITGEAIALQFKKKELDMSRLRDNLKYSIDQLTRALDAISRYDDGKYKIEYDDTPISKSSASLFYVDFPSDYPDTFSKDPHLMGFARHIEEQWKTEIYIPWDGETDVKLIGEYDTQDEAVEALWQNRHESRIRQ